MNNTNTNKKRKVSIKYENIIGVLYVLFAMYQTYYHIELNGLYTELFMEILIHIMFFSTIHYIIKDIRKNPENWK